MNALNGWDVDPDDPIVERMVYGGVFALVKQLMDEDRVGIEQHSVTTEQALRDVGMTWGMSPKRLT